MSSINRRLRTPSIACAALVWILAVAAPAGAEVGVGFTPERDLGEDGIAESQLAIEADSATPENDRVTVTVNEESVTVSEPGGVIGGGEGCTQSNATSITCPRPFLLGIRTYGGNDTVTVAPSLPAFVEGGIGADTITVGFGRVFGEEGADTLTTNGEPGAEQVFDGQNPDNWDDYGALADGYSGIQGGPGDDELTSGDEGEVLVGEQGEDTIDGGAGRDIITGNAGTDTLRGGEDDDQLEGDFPVGDADVVFANDTIEGGSGLDTLAWERRTAAVRLDLADNGTPDGQTGENDDVSGIEIANTGSGEDTITGTDGDETFDPGRGADSVAGGNGVDSIAYGNVRGPVRVDLSDTTPDGVEGELDILTGIDGAIGSPRADTLIGDSGGNPLDGGDGNDDVFGGDGDDLLASGEDGRDTLNGGGGNDVLTTSAGTDDIQDTMIGGPGDDDLTASSADRDRLEGNGGDDILRSGRGDRDELLGGRGADVLKAGRGCCNTRTGDRDLLDGGPGSDELDGGKGLGDVVLYTSRTRAVTADLRSGGGIQGEGDTYAGIEVIRGGSGDDDLTGRKRKPDRLIGGVGDDLLDGLTGRDGLKGGAGDDTMVGEDGQRDGLSCGAGFDRFSADNKDTLRGCEQVL